MSFANTLYLQEPGPTMGSVAGTGGISVLPNEILYLILDSFPSIELSPILSVSRRFQSLILRLLHHRLSNIGQDGHSLIVECYHPSARLVAGHLYCNYLGTDGLDGLHDRSVIESDKKSGLANMYSRFRPQRKGPERSAPVRPGDIPGSRTHPSTAARRDNGVNVAAGLPVTETITLDAHELFSQLCCTTSLVTMRHWSGLITSAVEVCDGMLRVFRDWLTERVKAEEGHPPTPRLDPTIDPSILWVNNSSKTVGMRFKVRERKWRRDNPVLYSAEEEVAVSYYIDFEELVVKSMHLVQKIEEAVVQQQNLSSKTVVLRSYS